MDSTMNCRKKKNSILPTLTLTIVVLSMMFCSSSQQKVKATLQDPITIKPQEELSGKLSNYPEYTYNWLSKAMVTTSNIRGLDFTKDLKFFTTTTKELPELIGTGGSDEDDSSVEDFFQQIGFLHEDETFNKNNENDSGNKQDYSSVGGFYGIGANIFVLVTDTNPAYNPYSPVRFTDVVLVHELTHALQDMNFNLARKAQNVMTYKRHTDSLMAFKSLMEGDAILTQYLFLMKESPHLWHLKGEQKRNFVRHISDRFSSSGYSGTIENDIPNYWLRKGLFIYLQGAGFVSQLYLAGGYKLINKALSKRIPASTEQIMHPTKYIDNDIPTEIEIPTLYGVLKSEGGGAWNRKYDDTLGEFNIYVLMDKHLTKKGMDANKIAEGWDGDRVEYFLDYSTGDDAMVWITAWDSENDAREFLDAYVILMAEKQTHKQDKTKQQHIKSYGENEIIWEDNYKNLSYAYINDRVVYIMEDIPLRSFKDVKNGLFSSKISKK